MKLYIIRHGETDWNRERRLQGKTDIELNDYGRELAEVTSEALKEVNFDLIFSSPLKRAYETAVILRRNREIPLFSDARLCEVCFGKYEGTVLEERSGKFAFFFDAPEKYVAEEGAESYEEILSRAKSFIGDKISPVFKENPDANVLISGHGAINRALMAVLRDTPLKDYWKGTWQRNCCVNIFEITDKKVVLLEEGKIYYTDLSNQTSYVSTAPASSPK